MKNYIVLVVLAFSLPTISQAAIVMVTGGQYQIREDQQPLRSYIDLGDQDSSPQSIREGYVLRDNEIAGTVQFSWNTNRQPWRFDIPGDGFATFTLGSGPNASVTTVPYVGTSHENALYIATFAQGWAPPNSRTGINVGVDRVNHEVVGGRIEGTFAQPDNAGGGYGMVYGFACNQPLTIEGWVELVNPNEGAAPYSYAFQAGTGHTDLVVPEPGVSLTLAFGALLLGLRRKRS